MHVVFLVRRYHPHLGGVERHLEGLIRTVLQLDGETQISVITEQYHLELPLLEKHAQVSIYRVPLFPHPDQPNLKSSISAGMRSLLPILESADVIHVHDVFFWLLPLLPWLLNSKIFITFHGYEVPGPPSLKQRWWHQLAEMCSDGNMCIGAFHQKWYGVDPTVVSYGAVDQVSDHTRSVKSAVLESHERRFLFVGRLEEDTGIWAYLQAFAEIRRTAHLTTISIDVVGDGELRAQLEQFVQDEQLPVRFLGKQKVNSATYIGYTASLVSGYLSMLESLAAGVPVIATYMTLLKFDYLRDSPFYAFITLAQPGKALQTALCTDHQLTPEAVSWARQQTWQKLADQYLQLWRKPQS